jgi:hypothetical protein
MLKLLLFSLCFSLSIGLYSQNLQINTVYENSKNYTIDLDSIYNKLEDNLIPTIIVIRGEDSMDKTKTISKLSDHLNTDFSNINIISYELHSAKGLNFFEGKIKSSGKDEPFKFDFDLYLTVKNKDYFNFLSDYYVNSGVMHHHKLNRNYLQFLRKSNYSTLNDLISDLNYNVILKYLQLNIAKNDQNVRDLNKQLLSIRDSIKTPKTNELNIASYTNFYFPISHNFYNLSYNLNFGVQFSYHQYPFENLKFLGFGLGIEWNRINANIQTNYIDTLTQKQYDIDGDMFYRVVYGNNLNEQVEIEQISLIPTICFKFVLNDKWNINFTPGLKISNYTSSTYSIQDGLFSYGAIYPTYGNDTIFSGLYDNLINVSHDNNNRNLDINITSLSLHLPIAVELVFNNNIGVFAGGFLNYGLTNIIKPNLSNKYISSNYNEYNSMLYQFDNVFLHNYGLFLGLSIKF